MDGAQPPRRRLLLLRPRAFLLLRSLARRLVRCFLLRQRARRRVFVCSVLVGSLAVRLCRRFVRGLLLRPLAVRLIRRLLVSSLLLRSLLIGSLLLNSLVFRSIPRRSIPRRRLPVRRLARLPFGPYLGLEARGLGLAFRPLALQSLPVRLSLGAQLLRNFISHALELGLGLS